MRRALLPLSLVFFAAGSAMAVVLPFLSLFLSTAVRAGPIQVTVFLVVGPLAGVVAATLLGRWSDRWPIRRALLIGASTAGLIGMGLTAFVRNYWILLALTVSATALAGAMFPQTFAYARQVLARTGGKQAALGISSLRTVFSLAWVAGPPLGAVLLHAGGFTVLFGVAAGLYALSALVAVGWLGEPEPGGPPKAPDSRRIPASHTLLLSAVAFTMLQTPLTLAVQALPLFISTDLGGDVRDAGLILGLCAALEIPLMLGLGALAARIRLRLLVLAGAGCGVGYYALVAVSSSVWMLAAAQLLDALFIAAVSGLGIAYMQDLLPQSPGQATTLFTNSFPIGAMLSGPLFGLAQHFGYRLGYVMAASLCLAGLTVLLATRPPAVHAGLPAPAPVPRQPVPDWER
jgi:SET family sugar efflux transporter-like MFS transporter